MKRPWIILLLFLMGVVVVKWRRFENVREPTETARPNEAAVQTGVGGSTDSRLEKLPDGHVAMRDAIGIANSLHAKSEGAEVDLGSLDQLLELYRFVFKANPVGSENQEIMAQLLGHNAKKLVFFPRNHPSLNGEGALLDRWGMPYYFHPLSAQLMDMRTAGPDGNLWTKDDLSLGLDTKDEVKAMKLVR